MRPTCTARRRICANLVMLAAGCAACTTPDTGAGLREFLDATRDAGPTSDGALPEGSGADFSGSYLFAVQASVGGGPILFEATVGVRGDEPAQVFDLTLQPLKTERTLEGDLRPDPRAPVGPPTEVVDIPLENGAFTFEVRAMTVPGDANSVTFQDIVADLFFSGAVLSPVAFCGSISGTVIVPFDVDLAGSTFYAEQTADVAAAEIRVACP